MPSTLVTKPWSETIYVIGDAFRARGASLPEHLQSLLKASTKPTSADDVKIWNLYCVAAYEATAQERLLDDLYDCFRSNPNTADIDVLEQASFRSRLACMRAHTDLFGDCIAMERHATRIGFAAGVFDMVDAVEGEISLLTEELEDLDTQWRVVQRDFHRRVEQGELIADSSRGWVERDELQYVGARTCITDLSRPASWEDIEGKSCPVCLEAFVTSQQAVRLNACSHVIDAECLDTWVNSMAKKCNTCVLCRRELFYRRQREPSAYMEWFRGLRDRHTDLEMRIMGMRYESQQLAMILEEIQPSRVAQSLGR